MTTVLPICLTTILSHFPSSNADFDHKIGFLALKTTQVPIFVSLPQLFQEKKHETCVARQDKNRDILLMSAKNKNVHKTGSNRVMKLKFSQNASLIEVWCITRSNWLVMTQTGKHENHTKGQMQQSDELYPHN